MTDDIIVLCPGQGAQRAGMGKGWVESSPAAAEVFSEADAALDFDLSGVCFDGSQERLNRTDLAQPAIYVTSVACYRALDHDGVIDREKIVASAGLSLGEFTSLHLAGVFGFVDGLRLVHLRGQAMQEAAEAQSGGMVVLIGADEGQATEICESARGEEVLVPANFNCPGQVVVSGSRAACERALGVAQERGLNAKDLSVSGAFHSPLMAPAAEQLATALDEISWSRPRFPVVSNVTGEPYDPDNMEAMKKRLVEQLTVPVRWTESMQWTRSHLSAVYIELDPGRVLSGLMRRIDRQVKVQKMGQEGVRS